jgi:ribonuclease HI
MKYIAYCDGGSRGNPGPAASAFVTSDSSGVVSQAGVCIGDDTNNVAEWTSLILALDDAKKNNYYPITIKMDSLLVVSQINDKWKVKTPHLMPYYKKAKTLMTSQVTVEHVRREFNKEADKLVNEALDNNKS